LSQKAVDLARQNGIDAHYTHVTDGLPFGTAEFDVVLACFVLHFKIQEATFGEIRRVLKPSGVFVFNLFNIDTDIVVDSLEQSGFSVSCSSPNCALKSNHSVWSALPLTPLESS
jgi:ubiquinone/menaquinone biosynthesis C-methylase UbiE